MSKEEQFCDIERIFTSYTRGILCNIQQGAKHLIEDHIKIITDSLLILEALRQTYQDRDNE